MSKYEDKLIDGHVYDGIQEYDNPMPAWWMNLFIVTIIWAVVYCIAHVMGYAPTYESDLHVSQQELQQMRQDALAKNPPVEISNEAILAASKDDTKLVEGNSLFAGTCAACHGEQGQGSIGPNLTDPYWIYGAEPIQIMHVVEKGTENGMPDHEGMFSPEQRIAIVGYVLTLQGTNPPDAKAPEGELYESMGGGAAPADDAQAPAAEDGAASEAEGNKQVGQEDAQTEGQDDAAPVPDTTK